MIENADFKKLEKVYGQLSEEPQIIHFRKRIPGPIKTYSVFFIFLKQSISIGLKFYSIFIFIIKFITSILQLSIGIEVEFVPEVASFSFESLLAARNFSFVIWSEVIVAKVHVAITIVEALPFRKIWVAVVQVLKYF